MSSVASAWDTAASADLTNEGAPVPLFPYRSVEFFELERDRIFRRAWLNIARIEDVAIPGDFIMREIEILRTSIIISHGKDGRIRAFHNVCPHRGNQMVDARSGSAPVFVCGYHAWTFGNDGSLRHVPDDTRFCNLDKAQHGLCAVRLEIFEGWIFVNFAEDPELSLEEFLGDFGDRLRGLPNINDGAIVTFEARLNCNWKIVSDAFLEGYHIQAIHSSTLKTMFSPADNPYGRPLEIRTFGPHGLNSMYGNPDHRPAPHQMVEAIAYDPAAIAPDHLEAMGQFARHEAVNPTRSVSWSMDKNLVFPNTQIDFGPTGFWTHQFWPISVDQTRHEARFFLRAPQSIEERFAQEYQMAHAADIILEDLGNVERTQKGVESAVFDTMPLSDSEFLIRHNVATILRWTAADSMAEAIA